MARSRKRTLDTPTTETPTAEQPTETSTAVAERDSAPDVFDEQIALRNAERVQRETEHGTSETRPAETDGNSRSSSHHQHTAEVARQDAEPAIPREHHGHAAHHAPHREHGYSAGIEKKKFAPPADPFGFENVKAGENRVQLLKSEGHGAWVIRFAHNPNHDKGPDGETYGKDSPHPVLKMLKEEGYRWGFDSADGKGGWGKAFTGDAYGADHIEARKILQKAADMIGQPKEHGRIPD
jgi:hypothetical protein